MPAKRPKIAMGNDSTQLPSAERRSDPGGQPSGSPATHGVSAHEIRFRELEQSLATISAREGQVRTALVEAHDQLLRRDEQLRETNTALDQLTSELERLTSAHDVLREERDRLADENHDFWRSQNEAREIIRSKDLEIAQLIVRLERVVNSRPVQVWLRFGRLPLVRSIFARRGARDSAELGQGARADR